MSNDKYNMNIEEGIDLLIKTDRHRVIGKMIVMPEDMLPKGHPQDMKMKKGLIFLESKNTGIVKGETLSYSVTIDLDPSECKQFAEFLMKVWEESQ